MSRFQLCIEPLSMVKLFEGIEGGECLKLKRSSAIVIGLMIFFIFPFYAFAHSALVSTVPDKSSDSEVPEIILTFNEDIEPVSKVTVTNASGEELALKEIKTDGKVMTAVFEKPLTDGVYQVNWNIISVDGHPVSGSYTFEVNIPEPEPTPTVNPPSEQPADPTPSPAQPVESPAPAASPAADQGNRDQAESAGASGSFDFSKWMLIAAFILLILAVAVSIWKKRRS